MSSERLLPLQVVEKERGVGPEVDSFREGERQMSGRRSVRRCGMGELEKQTALTEVSLAVVIWLHGLPKRRLGR